MEPSAQYEIRSYANVMGEEIVRRWCPITWEAFVDYRLNAMALSRLESSVLSDILSGDKTKAMQTAEEAGWLSRNAQGELVRNRERMEFEAKLAGFGVQAPWQAAQD
jgi:thymidylate synthase (FAD)